MPGVAIPLGVKAYSRKDAFTPETRLKNLYLEKDESGVSPDGFMRIQRPGMVSQYALSGAVRGMEYRTTTGETLVVAGGQLYANAGTRGDVPGTANVAFTSTTFYTSLVADGSFQLYDATLTTVAVPDILDVPQTPQDVDQLNQYTLLLLRSGSFYWLPPGETVLDPLNFATAESSPDKGVALRRVGDEFWIFGAETTEVWQSTGDLDAPFQRVSGRYYERGCLSRDTVRRFDNTIMWVGDDGQVYRGGAVPQVVSDNGIAERIRERTGDLSAWTFGWDGHDFYVLNIGGQGTFAYDAQTQQWCEFGWTATTGLDANGTVLVGEDSGIISRLDASAGTDNGVAIERIVTGTYGFMGRAGRNDSLSIGVSASADCVVRLRWKDGQEEYPDYYDEIDIRAPLDVAQIRRMGTPLQPYRTVELSCLDSARIRIAGCEVNNGWAR